jgi:hypothetical protein
MLECVRAFSSALPNVRYEKTRMLLETKSEQDLETNAVY